MPYEESKACPSCGSGYVSRQLEKGLCFCNHCGNIWDVPKKEPDPEIIMMECALCRQMFQYKGDHLGVRLCDDCIRLQYPIESEPPDVSIDDADVEAPWEDDRK